jgi:hypothetical protein
VRRCRSGACSTRGRRLEQREITSAESRERGWKSSDAQVFRLLLALKPEAVLAWRAQRSCRLSGSRVASERAAEAARLSAADMTEGWRCGRADAEE